MPSGVTIIPTFGSSIANDPNHAAIESTINSAIAYYARAFTNPITVTIDFEENPGSGIPGTNLTSIVSVPYSTFLSALSAQTQTPDVTKALANLPVTANNPVDNTANLTLTNANVRALGITSVPIPPGSDSTITFDTDLTTPGSPGASSQPVSLFAVAEHEIDEVLGLGSSLPNDGSAPTNPPAPEDLYRYSATTPGTRNYVSTGDDAWFSLDGTTDLVQFNQNVGLAPNGGDYGDWWSNNGGGNTIGGNPPARVQDAFGGPGTLTIATDPGQVELRALNVIGYEYAASGFLVSAPTAVDQGLPFTITVTAVDQFGNPVSNYTGTVHFTSTDPSGTLPANYTFTATDAGSHTFTNGVTLRTLGSQTITATDTAVTTFTGKTTVTVVTQLPASQFQVSAPATVLGGGPFSMTVTAEDALGNVVKNYAGTVHFSSTDPSGTLPANYTFTAADAGVHTFTNGVTLRTLGSQTITATDTVTNTITGSTTVNVTQVAALLVSAPATVLAGVPFSVTVSALDPTGAVVNNYIGTVHFTSTDPASKLPTNYTFTSADAGVHTFTVMLGTLGNQIITATDTVNSTITGSTSVLVNPVPLPVESVTYYTVGAGSGGTPEVKVYDAGSNQLLFDFFAFNPSFSGGVRVAVGDINGDGTPDIITVPGPGGGPEVRVFNGLNGLLMADFLVFDRHLSTGLNVAAGDITGDGKADIVVAPSFGGGPNVHAYSGATGALIQNFLAFNPKFGGGVQVAVGRLTNPGVADIVAAAGPTGGPQVNVYDGPTGVLIQSFMAYTPTFGGGVSVATGNFGGGLSDIITGPGLGGTSDVRVFSVGNTQPIKEFQAPPQAFISVSDGIPIPAGATGVRVSSVDQNGVQPDFIMVSYGQGVNSVVNIYDFTTLQRIDTFFAFSPLFRGGVYIGSGH